MDATACEQQSHAASSLAANNNHLDGLAKRLADSADRVRSLADALHGSEPPQAAPTEAACETSTVLLGGLSDRINTLEAECEELDAQIARL